ncbi:acyl-[acyl-carrier-protein] thioesterase [Secundilactobacillus folii]|uniref:Acyl-ACP thioesterase n=1 Tax=Secundilactobacillus folii TaxID=2678357 RepID=A0A7X2XXZ4_9LACO|nr:acyl-ACP thioesterase domain-containing protein [Secundilactobacillus folii]MTV82401.1 acyl-ACP thioesterase [Secundilactobacillus folii]
MGASTFSEQHQITFYEADVTNTVTPAMLVNMIILASEHQTTALGVGSDVVAKQGLGWVVTQYKMDITRLPKADETITLTTRATCYNRYFAFREFWVHDSDGKECVHVESIWVTMDHETRKIVTIPANIIEPFESEKVKMIPRLARPKKLTDRDQLLSKKYRVRYFDIDGNGHVNNARYFDWLLDALPMSFLTRHDLTGINIRFENEVQYHHMVTSEATLLTDINEPIVTKHHIVTEDGGIATEAEFHWRPITNQQ